MRKAFQSFVAIASLILTISPTAFAQKPDHVVRIWPNTPPGPKIDVGPERDFTKDSDDLIAGNRIIKLGNVTSPEAHVYLPPKNLRTGAAVVVCPGGGFSILAWDLEGIEVAQWLNTLGIAGIVLKYRVPTRDQTPRWMAATQDTQRTVSITRHHAQDWGVDPNKVAVLGFSAGGMAAVKTTLAPHRYYDSTDEADKLPFRPDRAILIYAAGLPKNADEAEGEQPTENDQRTAQPLEGQVTAATPPVFMVHAFDDFVPVQGTANMLLAMKKAGVACELHVYESGGHGYGLRKRDDQPVTSWTAPCEAWLRRAGWLN